MDDRWVTPAGVTRDTVSHTYCPPCRDLAVAAFRADLFGPQRVAARMGGTAASSGLKR